MLMGFHFLKNFSPRLFFYFILLTIFFFSLAGNVPSIRDSVGLTRPYHVYEGDDALITCVVSNVGDNTVTWKKEDREKHSRRVLTAGENRVTGDKRFSVLHDSGKYYIISGFSFFLFLCRGNPIIYVIKLIK